MFFTNDQIARLNTSFGLLKPRLGQIADLFEQSLNEHAPMLASHFPIDRVSFELNMLLICGHVADVNLLTERYAEIGEDLAAVGVGADQYPAARDAMLRAFAAISGYTWTQRLENDWRALFDHIAHAALMPSNFQSQAA